MDTSFLAGIAIGSAATIALNLGKGVQKMKVHVLKRIRTPFAPDVRRDFMIWLGGVGLTTSASLFFSLALKMTDKPSIVSSLTGVGLLALIVFSHGVLHEKVGRLELVAAGLIIAGTVLMGFFHRALDGVQTYSPSGLFVSLLILVALYAVLVPLSLKKVRLHGVVFGALAGTLIGVAIILGDIALIRVGDDFSAQFATPYPYLAMFVGLFALLTTQIGFFRARAIVVVPCANCSIVLTPVLFEYLIFHTMLVPGQYLGILLILGGVGVLSSTT